ncbi:hypothetical protein B1F79_02640 [Coxiella-like endosymbiont of Rhipicephalus sanguineus]|nr:PspC domain-containing protein [Coxiella-like endosymbiont of Rhipicephalus sanguineus]MBT8506506.1 hypothetical protein [Coxiella-like endosymbiont of Rhipicephalus sanguineus]
MIAGVCGGVAHYFNIDPTWIRLSFVVLLLTEQLLRLLVYLNNVANRSSRTGPPPLTLQLSYSFLYYVHPIS